MTLTAVKGHFSRKPTLELSPNFNLGLKGILVSIEGVCLLSDKATADCNNNSVALNQCPESGRWCILNEQSKMFAEMVSMIYYQGRRGVRKKGRSEGN